MNIAKLLHEANKGFIVAPAGCGKTHLIAEAVINYGNARELILTHTHAGVDSIRRKIRALNPARQNYQIETIDGFILRYVSHFPHTSGWSSFLDDVDWASVRDCGICLFKKDFIKRIIAATYSGLYVDEYQDCVLEQHAIILELSAVLPARVLGDHLQGIFNFGENKIIDWEKDVKRNFREIGELNTPWRWNNAGNPDLGNWVSLLRQAILNNSGIRLTDLPNSVRWINTNSQTDVVKECFSVLSRINTTEGVVIIGLSNQPQRTHHIARKLRGQFGVIEPLESKDLKKIIGKLTDSCAYKRAIALLDIAVLCFSGISKTILTQEYSALEKRQLPNRRKQLTISDPLKAFICNNNLESMISLFDSFTQFPNSHLYRKELYFEISKILRESSSAGILLKDALIKVRENTRRWGRRIPKRAIARTVLIKGLEFDHAIVLDADSFDSKNLYVALTRACKTITIISKSDTLLRVIQTPHLIVNGNDRQ